MIHTKFCDQQGEPTAELEVADLRITGGVIWNHEYGLIAHYSGSGWMHRGSCFPMLWAEGPCRLHFGIARDPLPVSEPIGMLSIKGCTLRANGVAFAEYLDRSDMWQGLMRPFWWQVMRVVSEPGSHLLDASTVGLLNPWDIVPSKIDPSRQSH